MNNKPILLDTKKKQVFFAVIYGVCLPTGYFLGQYFVGGILGGALGVIAGYFIGDKLIKYIIPRV